MRTGLSFNFLDCSNDLPSSDDADVKSILNCVHPRPFSRSVINKGLLHSDFLVKHGTLRLLLEELKLLDALISALDSNSCSNNLMMQSWTSLKREIQNEVRNSFPDPQVLLSLFSIHSSQSKTRDSSRKRKAESTNLLKNREKKLKMDGADENTDIIIGGIDSSPQVLPKDSEDVLDALTVDQMDSGKDFMNAISEIWGSNLLSGPLDTLKDADIYFHSKLLDALRIYIVSFDPESFLNRLAIKYTYYHEGGNFQVFCLVYSLLALHGPVASSRAIDSSGLIFETLTFE